MRFEKVLELARCGGKFRRPTMGNAYIMVAKVAEDGRNPVFLPRLILDMQGMNHMTFTLSNEDIFAEDWEESEPIVPVKMYASSFEVTCPKCNRAYQVGEKWELRVGDLYKCTCGNRLLLNPPEEVERGCRHCLPPNEPERVTPVPGCKLMSDKVEEPKPKTIDQWPEV